MKILVLILLLQALVSCLPDEDLVMPPGMTGEVVYSGYLKTDITNRQIHYVFVAARNGTDKTPLTIWLNGGPGCSSLIGMLQEIGPYLVGNTYQHGDLLTKNEYSWNNVSNLLFLESPAIVGFSSDNDTKVTYTDQQTANDAFAAIKYFLTVKAPEFHMRDLYITGESYAGKYIPDITIRILRNNQGPIENYINIKGIMIGNGVMDFRHNSLEKSEIQYMYEHNFVDGRLWSIYKSACLRDFNSPRCQYFQLELNKYNQDQLNPYNVYEICKTKSTEAARLLEAIDKQMKSKPRKTFSAQGEQQNDSHNLKEIIDCPSDEGAIAYWNLNKHHYHVDHVNKTWEPCSFIQYEMSQDGSMKQYAEILLNKAVRIWLYSGDWDDVVPYRDTEKNLKKLNLAKVGPWDPWFVGDHHAGFYQMYEKLTHITVKAGSHMVPQARPKPAFQLFYNFIKNRPVNTPI